ncbi:MAG: hemerythrin domain-containing protein [Saprospiraceae bacterium]|nr:hemerythrin domain-containing protein [Saprospiraceae bacterium]
MTQPARPSLVVTPHKGIRHAFSQLSLIAGNTDYNNKYEVAELKEQLEEFGELLEEHAHLENEFILKALEAKVPGSSDHDEQDHLDLEAQQTELLAKLEELLDPTISPAEANQKGYGFYQDLSKLHTAHLEHMLEEEQVTQALTWQHFTDEEIMGLHVQIIQHIPPAKMLAWMKYILPALNHGERVGLLKGMQAGAPAAFFEQVMSIAEMVLPSLAFKKLENNLMVGAFQY